MWHTKVVKFDNNFYNQLEQTAFVLRHSYELVLKLTQKNLTYEAFPIMLGDQLYQMSWNSQVEF